MFNSLFLYLLFQTHHTKRHAEEARHRVPRFWVRSQNQPRGLQTFSPNGNLLSLDKAYNQANHFHFPFQFLPIEPAETHKIRHKAGTIEARPRRPPGLPIARESPVQPRCNVDHRSVLHRCDRSSSSTRVSIRSTALFPGARGTARRAVLQLRIPAGTGSMDLQFA